MKISVASGSILAATAAAFVMGATISAPTAQAASKVKCYGVNACKGTSACKTAANACKGQNACKGTGFKMSSKSSCKADGGKLHG